MPLITSPDKPGRSKITAQIKTKAFEHGFHLVGIAPATRFPEADHFRSWLANGYAANMSYLTRNVDKREDCRILFPPAKSVVVCGMSYHSSFAAKPAPEDPTRGVIARYAWGDDYHLVVKNALYALLGDIRTLSATPIEAKVCVDTVPLLERLSGYHAGLGWIGKNTCLIDERYGSWFFLGEILLNLELDYDAPVTDRCGACTRCLDACPTGALVAPRQIDARRCLSYLTIEHAGEIPVEFHAALNNRVFGCDRCQEVCPWNQQAQTPGKSEFLPREQAYFPELNRLLRLTPEQFQTIFYQSPILRAKLHRLQRNARITFENENSRP